MNKRGVITTFVLLGIVIVTITFLLIFLKTTFLQSSLDNSISKSITLPQKVQSVSTFMEGCIEENGYDALYWLGKQGGYLFPPQPVTSNNVPYFSLKGKSFFPSKEQLEQELSLFMNQEVSFCTKDFSKNFPHFRVQQGRVETKTTILDEKVIFTVIFPIKLTENSATFMLGKFGNIEVFVREGTVYNVASSIVKEQLLDPERICLSCLISFGNQNDIQIDIKEEQPNTLIITLVDEKSVINELPYRFTFAHGY